MTTENTNNEMQKWPPWKEAAKQLRARPDYGYGMQVPAKLVADIMHLEPDSVDYNLQLLQLRVELEHDDGYKLCQRTARSEEDGRKLVMLQIPSAKDHVEDIPRSFRQEMGRLACRSVRIIDKTLGNDTAKLTDGERLKAEKALQIAQTRVVLLRRECSVANYIRENKPKLLENGH